MYRKTVLIAVCAMFLGYSSTAQNTNEEAYQKGLEIISKMSAEERADYYRIHHSRKPNAEQMEKLRKAIPAEAVKQQKSEDGLEMPEKFWYPGEFEEVQAVLISWSYIHVDPTETYGVDPITKDTAYWTDENKKIQVGKYKSYVDIYDDYSRKPIISAQLADAIQKGGAEVWINVVNSRDSTTIKTYMKNKGMPLTNYRFFINPNNSIWYRDCGPVAFYYGDQDSIAFMDFEYYSGRPADDKIPIGIANKLKIPVYTTTVKYEGGNIILDGLGTLFTSDMLYAENATRVGQVYVDNGVLKTAARDSLDNHRVNDSLSHLLGLERVKVLPRLRHDGGTGHIDLYAAMWDENSFVFTKYPPQMSKLTDYSIGLNNIDTMLSMNSFFDKPYRGRDIPLPKKDNNTWYTSNSDYSKYTRTYSNSLFVNNVIVQPIFSDDQWGARGHDLDAIEQMKKAFPGYTIIPIDIRGFEDDKDLYTGFDGSGGAIHCITKQIPAENPIRILHGAIQDFADDAVYNGNFPIEAIITNRSGIDSAVCFWRVKEDADWQLLPLAAGADNVFSAFINRPTTLANDTIEYYISATSNNGKTITKPITAPKGFYSFYHGTEAVEGIAENIYEDIVVVSLVNPTANALDHVDSAIYLEVTLRNDTTGKTYDTVVVNAIISDGENPDIELSEIITDFAPGGINYTFTSSYTVPTVADYTVTIFVNRLDNYPHNDTLKINRRTILREDLAVTALVSPTASSIDKMGSEINLRVRLENQCFTKIYDTVVVNALIKAKGSPDILLSEIITHFAPGTQNYNFDSSYTVPAVSDYTVKVFVNHLDNYRYNDTITVSRKTDLGINEYHNTGFSLGQNIPNPAQDNTRIEYSLPNDGQVIFAVYSITGQRLHIEKNNAYSGKNSIEFNTANLTNGIYYYFMEYNGERLVKKMAIRK